MATQPNAVPLADDKVDDWRKFCAELAGPRRKDFEDLNRRYGLVRHGAWLQRMPGGGYLVIVLREGASPQNFLPGLRNSTHPFDRWFAERISVLHGFDLTAVLPEPESVLDVRIEERAGAGAQPPS
jgi:hypothetical protein